MLCGDEINAAVVDIGTSYSRFGASGQNVPSQIFRSEVGDLIKDDGTQKKIFGDLAFRSFQTNLDVRSISDDAHKWDDIENILLYGLENRMRVDPKDFTLMLSQGKHLRDIKAQEKILEISLESLGSPALFTMPNSILNSLSAGRPTSLVVDCGSSGTTITPVVDGYELKRASIFTPVGGNLIDRHLSEYLLSRQVMVNPLGSIYGKTAPPLDPSFYHPNSLSFSASHPLLKNVKKSFLDLHYFDLVRDIKHWMAFIPHYRLAPEFRSDEGMLQAGIYMPPFYELPDGKQVASSYRLSITPELLFFPEKGPQNLSYPRPGSEGMSTTSSADSVLGKRARELIEIDRENSPSSAGFSITEESLSDLVYLAISRVDVDARKDLLSNIVLTGGTSLLGGLTQRLTKELTDITPTHLKVKVTANLPIERQHATWIGGSVLAICGTFHQMWISKKEYEEYGASLARKRFYF